MEVKEVPAIVVNGNYGDIIKQGDAVKVALNTGEEIECIFVGIFKDELSFDDGDSRNTFDYKIEEIKYLYSV